MTIDSLKLFFNLQREFQCYEYILFTDIIRDGMRKRKEKFILVCNAGFLASAIAIHSMAEVRKKGNFNSYSDLSFQIIVLHTFYLIYSSNLVRTSFIINL